MYFIFVLIKFLYPVYINSSVDLSSYFCKSLVNAAINEREAQKSIQVFNKTLESIQGFTDRLSNLIPSGGNFEKYKECLDSPKSIGAATLNLSSVRFVLKLTSESKSELFKIKEYFNMSRFSEYSGKEHVIIIQTDHKRAAMHLSKMVKKDDDYYILDPSSKLSSQEMKHLLQNLSFYFEARDYAETGLLQPLMIDYSHKLSQILRNVDENLSEQIRCERISKELSASINQNTDYIPDFELQDKVQRLFPSRSFHEWYHMVSAILSDKSYADTILKRLDIQNISGGQILNIQNTNGDKTENIKPMHLYCICAAALGSFHLEKISSVCERMWTYVKKAPVVCSRLCKEAYSIAFDASKRDELEEDDERKRNLKPQVNPQNEKDKLSNTLPEQRYLSESGQAKTSKISKLRVYIKKTSNYIPLNILTKMLNHLKFMGQNSIQLLMSIPEYCVIPEWIKQQTSSLRVDTLKKKYSKCIDKYSNKQNRFSLSYNFKDSLNRRLFLPHFIQRILSIVVISELPTELLQNPLYGFYRIPSEDTHLVPLQLCTAVPSCPYQLSEPQFLHELQIENKSFWAKCPIVSKLSKDIEMCQIVGKEDYSQFALQDQKELNCPATPNLVEPLSDSEEE